MKKKWRDTSSYSRGAAVRAPNEFTLDLGNGDRLVVHHYVGCGDDWFCSMHRLGLERVRLSAVSADEAMDAALAVARTRAMDVSAKLDMAGR